MSSETNIFGGKNPYGAYTPLTDIELEVLYRLAENDEYRVSIKDWGYVDKFKKITLGDARLSLLFDVNFTAPDSHIPVYFFDLTLHTHSGIVLYSSREVIAQDGYPQYVGSGVCISLCWDIQFNSLDPAIVKMVKPGAVGLTTREGNWRMNTEQKELLNLINLGKEKIKKEDEKQKKIAEKKQGY